MVTVVAMDVDVVVSDGEEVVVDGAVFVMVIVAAYVAADLSVVRGVDPL